MLVPDGLLLGRPANIRLHPDDFLVIRDISGKYQIAIVDLKDRSSQGLIPRGRGPMEMITAWDVEIYNGDVWVSGPQEGKMVRLTLDRDQRKFDAVGELDISASRFMRAMPFSDSEFLILSRAFSGKRMEIVTDMGESIREVGSFPEVRISGDLKPHNDWLQSFISISPDRKHTVVSYMTIDCIDIYDQNMELIKRLRGPVGVDPEFISQSLPAGTRFIQEPSFFSFQTPTSDNNVFFVGYRGVELIPGKDIDTNAYRIFSFDWNGRPLKCYTFDDPVWCFDVDTAGKKLYVATLNPESLEPEILIYNL